MKNLLLVFTLLLISSLALTAQVVVNSNITANTTWTKNNIYLLQGGCLYVTNEATLTIEPGTIIKGDQAALIISRGSKIIADGTANRPIVFTSNKPAGQRAPGDWGGLLIMGKAPINVPGGETVVEGGCDQAIYGGGDPADNSGILRYVRIEFAGVPFTPNNELNSLTLGGVGSGTVIEHVQTSYGGDDAFEWFGGTVNGKFLVAYRTVDDMFDTDFGYSGKNQWVLGFSDPNIADVSGSNGFESDNDASGSTNAPKTDADFSNVTVVGPIGQGIDPINSNYRRALHIRRCSYLDVFNSAFSGFPVGFKIEGACTIDGFTTNGEVEFVANVLAGISGNTIEPTPDAAVSSEFAASGNSILTNVNDLDLTAPLNFVANNPDFRPAAGSVLLSGADFSSPTLTDPFFTATTYRGAMGDTDWTDCWTEWDPTVADYSNSINYGLTPSISYTQELNIFSFTGTTAGATSYHWEFGDGSTSTEENPGYTYDAAPAAYTVTLTVTSERGCVSSTTETVNVISSTKEVESLTSLKVYPNPFQTKTLVEFSLRNSTELTIQLLDLNGRVTNLTTQSFDAGLNRFEVDGANLNAGIYFLRMQSAEGQKTVRISVLK